MALSNIKIIKNSNIPITIGLITHAALINNYIFNQGVDLSFANSTILLSWIIVALFLLLNIKSKYQGLEIFTLIPVLIIVTVFPLIQPDTSIYSSLFSLCKHPHYYCLARLWFTCFWINFFIVYSFI